MSAAKKSADAPAKEAKDDARSECLVEGCDRSADHVPGLCAIHYDTHRGWARTESDK